MKQALQKSLNPRLLRTGLLLFMAIVFSSSLFAQRQISGTVIDAENSDPLIGASILVKGSGQGVVTDVDGNFTVSANDGDALVISYTGYQTQEVTVGAENNITVRMSSGVTLETLVVTGYTSQSKKNISGAVATVDAEELKTIPVSNVAQAVQGKAAGVNVLSSGSPGGGISLRIRGYGTINNNEPLYIIDGIPTDSRSLQDLNPNDIESFQVLKDASAASIYGSRAANGVVIITTKNGSVGGKSKITLDVYYGIQQAQNLPELLSPQDLANTLWEGQSNAGLVPEHPQYGNGANPTIPTYIVPTAASSVDESLYDYQTFGIARANQAGTDWFDEIFDSAPIQSYNLSASGGTENGQYMLSAGYFNQEGTVIHTSYDRYTLRANTLFRVKDRIRVGENLSISYAETVGGGANRQEANNVISMAYRIPSIIPVYDVGGNFAGTRAAGMNNPDNPVALLTRRKDNIDKGIRVLGNAFLEVDIIEGLTAKTSFNFELRTTYENKSFEIRNVESAEPSAADVLNQRVDNNRILTWYNTLTYNKTFADKHNLQVLVGTEAITSQYTFMTGARTGYFSTAIPYRHLDAGEVPQSPGGRSFPSSLYSVFAKADYDLNGKYLLSATIRRDGSSRFGENNRYGVFPAFSAAWRVSDESFLKDVSFINDLKVRVGWGQTGNQRIGDFRFADDYSTDIGRAAYAIGGSNSSLASGFDSNTRGNPDVKWESTTSFNIGFDASLLNNQISVEFDWYDRQTDDMLIEVPPVSTLGNYNNLPFVNIGEMSNTGIDLALSYNSPKTGDFSYSVGVVFSAYNNEVVALKDTLQVYDNGGFREYNASRTRVGQPIGAFYGWDIEGIFQTQAEVDAHATQDGAAPGRFKYRDVNGDGMITADDRTFIGSPHPDFSYGLTANLNYKNFDLSIFLQGVSGNDIFNGNLLFTDFLTYFQNSNKGPALLDAWGYPGADNASATLPELNQNAPSRELEPSTYYVEDGSYLRLRTVSLGYTLSNDVADKIGVDNLRVYIQGNNIATFTDYSGLNPEVGLQDYYNDRADLDIGVDRGNYPVVSSWIFGINATF